MNEVISNDTASLGFPKIYLFCQKNTALPSWVTMGLCELTMINFKFFWLMATALSWPTKWLWPLYKWKKNCLDYRVHGIQIDRLGLTVSMQKSVLKNRHRVPRLYKKSVENRPSKPNHHYLTHFCRYLGTRCIFFETDFCVETVSPSRSIWIPWTL